MPSHKTFMIKKKLAKKQRQNRPIPYWIRMRTDNTIRYNAKRRHWRRTKLGPCALFLDLGNWSLGCSSGLVDGLAHRAWPGPCLIFFDHHRNKAHDDVTVPRCGRHITSTSTLPNAWRARSATCLISLLTLQLLQRPETSRQFQSRAEAVLSLGMKRQSESTTGAYLVLRKEDSSIRLTVFHSVPYININDSTIPTTMSIDEPINLSSNPMMTNILGASTNQSTGPWVFDNPFGPTDRSFFGGSIGSTFSGSMEFFHGSSVGAFGLNTGVGSFGVNTNVGPYVVTTNVAPFEVNGMNSFQGGGGGGSGPMAPRMMPPTEKP
ncbi:putative 60S ribosomal protein L39-3 [Salvia divinorum]|uniref:60S ribosomal protein L39-3 n=1 Tax=Salvia divinorum TaxID=28513 RepID=A0ABD1HC55_SALDI